ncbi:MAG: hypothetical protein M1830_006004 [Pleopsidium flavum]|nr:MAG: hypothetical protein M1830_006004 [Pleopsidium flavum]
MFVSCGGLNVLVEFLEEDYEDERDLVLIGVNGGPTPKNDFCRIFSRNSVLDPLSLVLSRVLDEEGELAELCEGRIANIFLLFSQAENHVKELVADRTVLYRVLRDLRRMSPPHQITMLKFIKNLSMLSTTLDSLQNANAIDTLIALLRSSTKEAHFREISNQVLNTLYNLCRLSKPRQEDAALNGIIPVLQRIVNTERPLKEFALPILCDMAHSGKVGRRELWKNKGLSFYITLLADPLQEETAKVEEQLLDGSFTNAIVNCFTTSKANFFEGLLEPLQKLLRLSPLVASSLAHPDLFSRLLQKLHTNKPVIRLNLLRILRSICEASYEHGGHIGDTGILDAVQRLVVHDPAVLVRNMAGELVKSCEENEKLGINGSRRRTARRTSATSTNTTPPSLMSSQSIPPTPTSSRSTQSNGYFDSRESRQRNGISGSIPFRPTSRDGSSSTSTLGFGSGYNVAAKSRLPRTTSTRSSRQSLLGSPKKEENVTPSAVPMPVSNSRRRRQASGDARWS